MIKLSEIVIRLKTANDELDELFEKSIMLPTKFDIHEYQMMENFIKTISDNLLHNQLLIAINGTGAFYWKIIC